MIFSTLIFFSSKWHSKFYKKIHNGLCFSPRLRRAGVVQKSLIIFIPFFILQLLLPLRHHLYRGNILWTEEGYRFSWRVMLVEKSGQATFTITNPENGQKAEIINSQYLTPFQEKQMCIQPDFMIQFAHLIAEDYQIYHGIQNPIVTVESYVALNARASQRFIENTVDLSKEKDTFAAKKWIVPFREK